MKNTDSDVCRVYDRSLEGLELTVDIYGPYARIMDYSKYRYDQMKKQKEARKNAKTVSVQEIRLSPNIQQHDIEIKARNAIRIINKEDKIKVSVRFRGREMAHKDLGREVLDKFFDELKDVAQISSKPKMDGRNMHMMIEPKSE